MAKPKSQLQLFKGKSKGGDDDFVPPPIEDAALADETQRRYISYALSVITSRALPDVRDGLKPVQRRILFGMQHDLHLRYEAKQRKCAAIVGDVMGKYHPHGDSSIYDALVRLAQSFSMRAPLVDGRGNFGSPDGDSPAAMRYTEARLQKLSAELLQELGQRTVNYRPNYDGTRFEPVVLPARFPNLLVNGSQGIAVGMATSIPPHNLAEVVDAAVAMIDQPEITVRGLLKHVKGPDFPTGGQLLTNKTELEEIYTTGQGGLKLRGEWKLEESKRSNPVIVIHSIPYAVERGTIVARIADAIIGKKLPNLLDVRDESTADTRIVLEIKKDADPQMIMAYLYKNTPLATNVQVNLTCLVPVDGQADMTRPARLSLTEILSEFLKFRMEVVQKRLTHDLSEIEKRIHELEGFATIFDALDETIRIIRRSEGKADAAGKLMKRFGIDEAQVDAILELKLYRLAQLEILLIREELDQKRKEQKRIADLLKSPAARWQMIRAELTELRDTYRDKRLTSIAGNVDEPVFDAEAFIVEEDAVVLLTQQGWIKRQREVKDVTTTRLREGDSVLDVAVGSTKSVIALFSNQGSCYVARVVDVMSTTGHGSPVQTMFKLADGERIVRMIGMDPRVLDVPPQEEGAEEPAPPYVVAVSRDGMCLRFSLRGHREPSTRSGRKYMRLAEGDETLYVALCQPDAKLACASTRGKALICEQDDVSLLAGAGKGVMLMRLEKGDRLVGAQLLTAPSDSLELEKENGTTLTITTRKYNVVSRAGKGFALFQRGSLSRAVPQVPTVPTLPEGGAA